MLLCLTWDMMMTEPKCVYCYQVVKENYSDYTTVHELCEHRCLQRIMVRECVKCGVKPAVKPLYTCQDCTGKSLYKGYGGQHD